MRPCQRKPKVHIYFCTLTALHCTIKQGRVGPQPPPPQPRGAGDGRAGRGRAGRGATLADHVHGAMPWRPCYADLERMYLRPHCLRSIFFSRFYSSSRDPQTFISLFTSHLYPITHNHRTNEARHICTLRTSNTSTSTYPSLHRPTPTTPSAPVLTGSSAFSPLSQRSYGGLAPTCDSRHARLMCSGRPRGRRACTASSRPTPRRNGSGRISRRKPGSPGL